MILGSAGGRAGLAAGRALSEKRNPAFPPNGLQFIKSEHFGPANRDPPRLKSLWRPLLIGARPIAKGKKEERQQKARLVPPPAPAHSEDAIGLTEAEAALRLAQFGDNTLAETHVSALAKLVSIFEDRSPG